MTITKARAARNAIGDAARCTGVHVETIRYYERIGLVPKPPRSRGGHRVYGPESLRRLAFIKRSRELGFPLESVRELLALADGGTCAEVQTLTSRHLEAVRTKIADLRRLETTLNGIATQCSGETILACPILDALSREHHLE